MEKENYTLAIVKSESQNIQKVSWNNFHQKMKQENITEAIIIPTDKEATDVNLAKRLLIGRLMKNNDVNHATDYAIIDHSDNDRLLPCILLFNPELQFAIMTTLQVNPDKYFIQAVIPQNSDELHINKCPLTEYDESFNDTVN
ncbi:MAG: hypothetical protein ACOC2E_03035 [Bacteroidota bacterium]